MTAKHVLVLFLCLSWLGGFAQTEEPGPIETDRPDQTETPALVPAGLFQAELGAAYEKADDSLSNFIHPNALLKFGLNKSLELRLIIEPSTVKFGEQTETGLAPIALGLKVRLLEEKGLLPKTSLIAHVSIPDAATDNFQTEKFAPDFRFVMAHTVSEKVKFSYNLGAEWDGFTSDPTYIYTVAPGFALSDKWGAFIEAYGFVQPDNKPDHRLDGGFTYLVKNNVQLDLSGGFGLSSISPDYFVAAGYSFRINK